MLINVKTSTNNYDVIIQKGILKEANKYFNLKRKVLIITDDGVPVEYVNVLQEQCLDAHVFTFKQGEASKNINTYQSIISFMLQQNFSRTDCIVALGGGVVGDLAGFVASTFMRGIQFYNIPTTLLSQVDSSIGGKTAIDFDGIKNVVGSFYPPSMVLIDTLTLKTLDKRQINAGLVEAIKMAVTFNADLFNLIKNSQNLEDDIERIIYQALMIKKTVVEEDEKESNIRKILNFGHTIGHAIESVNNLKLLHGECVGLGMLYMSNLLVRSEIEDVLIKYDLPVSIEIDSDKLIEFIQHDKKVNGEYISIIRCEEIGSYEENKILISELVHYL